MTTHRIWAGARRRNASGESTRVMLMEVAERLFATEGIEAVTLREIQQAAGQSNTSVIRYHFGSRDGLIRALIAYRQRTWRGSPGDVGDACATRARRPDPRAVVWLLVRPLANSIAAGEMFVPFLARLAEDPRARSEYWPDHVDDEWTQEQLEELVDAALQDLPERIRRGRTFQLYISLINVLAAAARSGPRPQRSAAAQLRRHLGRHADRAGVVRNARADVRRRRLISQLPPTISLALQVGDRSRRPVRSRAARHRCVARWCIPRRPVSAIARSGTAGRADGAPRRSGCTASHRVAGLEERVGLQHQFGVGLHHLDAADILGGQFVLPLQLGLRRENRCQRRDQLVVVLRARDSASAKRSSACRSTYGDMAFASAGHSRGQRRGQEDVTVGRAVHPVEGIHAEELIVGRPSSPGASRNSRCT